MLGLEECVSQASKVNDKEFVLYTEGDRKPGQHFRRILCEFIGLWFHSLIILLFHFTLGKGTW